MHPPDPVAPQQPRPTAPSAALGRGRTTIVIAALAGLLAVGLAEQQLIATTAHSGAWPAWTASDARFDAARAAYEETADRGASALDRAEALAGIATGDLVRAEDRTALEEGIVAARDILAETPAGPSGIVGLGDPSTPAPAWERYADLWRLVELIPARDAAAMRFEVATDRVASGTKTLADATDTLVSGTEQLAESALAASPLATYRSRVAVETALDGIRGASGSSSGAADRLIALTTAVADVRASHAAEQERQATHPLRAEIESFARSIAGGVELEFAWAYTVAGLSSDSWYSGTAEFKDDGDGWGLISLTESIEREWTADVNAKAVVVHEVGHTQVLRDECSPIFTAEPFAGDHEMWATAWAIGMGYDLPGAGIEAYGRPSDAQIAAASACR